MRINEILLETVQDDHVINQTARALADLANGNYWKINVAPYLFGPSRDPEWPSAFFQTLGFKNPALQDTKDPALQKLKDVQVRIRPIEGGQQAVMGRLSDGTLVILLNYDFVAKYRDNTDQLRSWMTDTLAHEIRHALDRIQRDASTSKKPHDFGRERYYQKQHIEGEPDSTQSEINAYFTQILHQVESDLKHNNITDLNRALKFGQDSLKDSQLADVVFGGWDNNNPVLRRLSARMAQFIHSLYDQK
jgi:hypothetical protein